MQRKKNISLLVSLAVLSLATLLLFWSDSNEIQRIDKDTFRVADLGKIDHIVINEDSSNVELTFDGQRWMVNGSLADRNMIEVLFATLQQAEPKREASKAIADSLSDQMNENGIHVSLYEGSALMDEFIVMGNANKTQAYFKKPGDEKPILMTIPGYRVYTAGVFELNALEWRNKLVFNLNWKNFKGLRADFLNDEQNSFEVGFGPDNYFTILDQPKADTTHLNDFLDAISYLTVDQFVTANSLDSLKGETPDLTITVSDVSGHNYSLGIFDIDNSSDMGVVIVPDGSYAMLDRRKLAQIIRRRSWFQPR